jgi:hypothetical protein
MGFQKFDQNLLLSSFYVLQSSVRGPSDSSSCRPTPPGNKGASPKARARGRTGPLERHGRQGRHGRCSGRCRLHTILCRRKSRLPSSRWRVLGAGVASRRTCSDTQQSSANSHRARPKMEGCGFGSGSQLRAERSLLWWQGACAQEKCMTDRSAGVSRNIRR